MNAHRGIYMPVIKTPFAERFRMALALRRVNQSELGRRLDPPVTQTAVSYWRNGHREPSYGRLIQISRALDVDVRFLLGLTDTP